MTKYDKSHALFAEENTVLAISSKKVL